MVSHPKTGSDSPIGSDRDRGRDRSYLDVFAWSYEGILGLDSSIVQDHLPILPHVRPVKHKLRRLHPRWSLQVKGRNLVLASC